MCRVGATYHVAAGKNNAGRFVLHRRNSVDHAVIAALTVIPYFISFDSVTIFCGQRVFRTNMRGHDDVGGLSKSASIGGWRCHFSKMPGGDARSKRSQR